MTVRDLKELVSSRGDNAGRGYLPSTVSKDDRGPDGVFGLAEI
jgi:hypothetical protein